MCSQALELHEFHEKPWIYSSHGFHFYMLNHLRENILNTKPQRQNLRLIQMKFKLNPTEGIHLLTKNIFFLIG